MSDELYEKILFQACKEERAIRKAAEEIGDRHAVDCSISREGALNRLWSEVEYTKLAIANPGAPKGGRTIEIVKAKRGEFDRKVEAASLANCDMYDDYLLSIGVGSMEGAKIRACDEVRAELGLPPLAEALSLTGKPIEIECGRVRIVTDGFGRGKVYFDGVETDLSIVGLKYEVVPGEMDKLHLTVNPAFPTVGVVARQIKAIIANRSAASNIELNVRLESPTIVENPK